MRRLLLALSLLLLASPCFAWGEKGHLIVNEVATASLPTSMPHFFYRAFPELTYLGPEPDRWRNGGVELNAVNDPDHFINYEYAAGLDLPRDRYAFIALMESSGRLRRFGIPVTTVGFLPWRIAELAQILTTNFRLWRNTRDPRERAYIEHDIIYVAGLLGHYAGDASNPHHATTNFNGWLDPNPHGYANDCAIHARFESDFISRVIETKDVAPLVTAPRLRTDYFAAAMELLRDSNANVERVYQLDRDGGFDPFKPVSPEAKAFAAKRIAIGASFLRDLWVSAWVNSEVSASRRRR